MQGEAYTLTWASPNRANGIIARSMRVVMSMSPPPLPFTSWVGSVNFWQERRERSPQPTAQQHTPSGWKFAAQRDPTEAGTPGRWKRLGGDEQHCVGLAPARRTSRLPLGLSPRVLMSLLAVLP